MKKLPIVILVTGAIVASILLVIDRSVTPDEHAERLASGNAGAGGSSISERREGQVLGMPVEKNTGSVKNAKADLSGNRVGSAQEGKLSQKNYGESSSSNSTKSQLRPRTSDNAGSSRGGSNSGETLQSIKDKALEQRYNRYFDIAPLPLSEAQRSSVLAILSQESASRSQVPAEQLFATATLDQGIMKDQLMRETEQKLKAILPEEDVAALVQYKVSLPDRAMVEDAAALCANNGLALSPETVDDLTKILHTVVIGYGSGGREVPAEQYNILTRYDAQAVAAAANILTPEQLALFKKSLAGRYTIRN